MLTIDIFPESASKYTFNVIRVGKTLYTLKTPDCFSQAVVVSHLPDI